MHSSLRVSTSVASDRIASDGAACRGVQFHGDETGLAMNMTTMIIATAGRRPTHDLVEPVRPSISIRMGSASPS